MDNVAGGWIKLHRVIMQNWTWKKKPFSYGQAFVDMILSANHRDSKVYFSSSVIDCKRGEYITSEVKLARQYGWSRMKLRRYIKLLENDKMITTSKTAHHTRITIENYEIYQEFSILPDTALDTGGDTGGDTGERQVTIQHSIHKQEYKNEKNIKKETKAKKESEFSEEASRFSKWFSSLLPDGQKITESQKINWAKTYDEMIKIDKRTKDQIAKVCKWARNDSFWISNFLSATKLRKTKDGVQYFDIFLNRMNAEIKNGNGQSESTVKKTSTVVTIPEDY